MIRKRNLSGFGPDRWIVVDVVKSLRSALSKSPKRIHFSCQPRQSKSDEFKSTFSSFAIVNALMVSQSFQLVKFTEPVNNQRLASF